MDLEVWEVNLKQEQVRGLHSFNGWYLPTELEEFHTRVAGVGDKLIVEVGELSQLVLEISNTCHTLKLQILECD
jgi:hypothetical protein